MRRLNPFKAVASAPLCAFAADIAQQMRREALDLCGALLPASLATRLFCILRLRLNLHAAPGPQQPQRQAKAAQHTSLRGDLVDQQILQRAGVGAALSREQPLCREWI